MLTELTAATRDRRDLRDLERMASPSRVVNGINAHYGARAVHFGNLGDRRPAELTRAGLRSPPLHDELSTVR